MLEVTRCMLFRTLDAVERELCVLRELLELEAMLRMLLCMLEDVEGGLCSLEVWEVLEVMRCILTPNAGCCGRRDQFRGLEISIVAAFSLQSAHLFSPATPSASL